MMPSGSVNIGEPAAGVVHPSTHVSLGAPRFGPFAGRTGSVGDGATLADGTNGELEAGGAGEGVAGPPPPSSHAVKTVAHRAATIANPRIAARLGRGRSRRSCTADSIGASCDEGVCTVSEG
jgi:hypothetical protein